jgi:hypothetical protein
MAIKVKEIKDDALMDIKVNKNFYLMSKDALYTIFKHLLSNESEKEKQKWKTLFLTTGWNRTLLQTMFYCNKNVFYGNKNDKLCYKYMPIYFTYSFFLLDSKGGQSRHIYLC